MRHHCFLAILLFCSSCGSSTEPASQIVEGVVEAGSDLVETLNLVPDSVSQSAAAIEDSVLVSQATLDEIQRKLDALSTDKSITEVTQTSSPLNIDVRGMAYKIFYSGFLLLITFLLIKAFVFAAERIAERRPSQRLFYKRLIPIFRMAMWVLVFSYIGFFVIGSALLPAAAAIGVAVGLAGQDLFKNIFGGLIIIVDQPFQTGDRIQVGGSYGEVVSIGLRSTRIQTLDDNLVTVPNAEVMASQVSNANAGELNCQVVTDLYLPGWVDEREAKSVAHQVAATSKYLFREKPIVVLVKDKYEHGFVTHLQVKAYVLDTRFESLLMSDITERARSEFRKKGLLPKYHGASTMVDIKTQLGQAKTSSTKSKSAE